MRLKLLLILALFTSTGFLSWGQDTLKSHADSLIDSLTYQVQTLRLQEIVLREQLAKNGQNAQRDSLRKAERKHQIDSLRKVTVGVPVVVEGDTLFRLYAPRGGVSPATRAKDTERLILAIGKRLSFSADSLHLFESEHATDIMYGDRVLLSVSDLDGLWQNTTRQSLARKYEVIIDKEIQALQAEYGLETKLKGAGLCLLIILAQIGLIWLTNKLFHKLRRNVVKWMRTRLKPIKIKDYEFLDVHKQGLLLLFFFAVLRFVLIIIQLLISIPLLFSIFPETQNLAYKLISFVWNPVKEAGLYIFDYLPNLIKIVLIVVCFHYTLKGLKYMAGEIASGKLKIKGFYAEWATPTYHIIRLLAFLFMLIVMWPLLPYSDSVVFKGASVFVGLIVSIGSTSIIGNLISGLVITYMRPFRLGDYIKVQDVEGDVIEKTAVVTRLRTPKNDVVTVPNSSILTSQTTNYTEAARKHGIIIHTEISIGYSVDRKKVESLLLKAAEQSTTIMKKPRPFVLVTALDDFYIRYQINAYSEESHILPNVYSELREHILDQFNEAGVEIMSPHYYARRDGEKVQLPPQV